MEPGGCIVKCCGPVAGYLVAPRVERWRDDGHTLGLYLEIYKPTCAVKLEGGLPAGVMLDWALMLSPNISEHAGIDYFSSAWGFGDIFDKPWAEAEREGSPHFPNGKLEVKATVKLAVKDK